MKRRRYAHLLRWRCYRVCELDSFRFGQVLVNVLQILARLYYVRGLCLFVPQCRSNIRHAGCVRNAWVQRCPWRVDINVAPGLLLIEIKLLCVRFLLLDIFRSVLLMSVNARFTDDVSAILCVNIALSWATILFAIGPRDVHDTTFDRHNVRGPDLRSSATVRR